MALAGFPFVNFASDWRNLGAQAGSGATRVALAIPRYKYTFLVEFQINSTALDPANSLTNAFDFWRNGKMYGQLKSFDYPRVSFKNEKMRSYNKWRVVPTQLEYTPFTMTFHDDATSMVTALWKEYMNFYHETGNIGVSQGDPTTADQTAAFTLNERVVGDGARLDMTKRPSIGMKLRPTAGRHFFDSIVIYDLGTEPDSVNVYTLHRPSVTAVEHDQYDHEDKTSKMTMTWSMDYEGLYFVIGQNRDSIRYILAMQLGDTGDLINSVSTGHARMVQTSVLPTITDQNSDTVPTSIPDPLQTSSGQLLLPPGDDIAVEELPPIANPVNNTDQQELAAESSIEASQNAIQENQNNIDAINKAVTDRTASGATVTPDQQKTANDAIQKFQNQNNSEQANINNQNTILSSIGQQRINNPATQTATTNTNAIVNDSSDSGGGESGAI